MKTFKLCALSYTDEDKEQAFKSFPLIDGLIINKEDEGKNWMIEALLEESQFQMLEESKSNEETLRISATISTEKNRPVPFMASVYSVNMIENNTHVLFNASRIEKL